MLNLSSRHTNTVSGCINATDISASISINLSSNALIAPRSITMLTTMQHIQSIPCINLPHSYEFIKLPIRLLCYLMTSIGLNLCKTACQLLSRNKPTFNWFVGASARVRRLVHQGPVTDPLSNHYQLRHKQHASTRHPSRRRFDTVVHSRVLTVGPLFVACRLRCLN